MIRTIQILTKKWVKTIFSNVSDYFPFHKNNQRSRVSSWKYREGRSTNLLKIRERWTMEGWRCRRLSHQSQVYPSYLPRCETALRPLLSSTCSSSSHRQEIKRIEFRACRPDCLRKGKKLAWASLHRRSSQSEPLARRVKFLERFDVCRVPEGFHRRSMPAVQLKSCRCCDSLSVQC